MQGKQVKSLIDIKVGDSLKHITCNFSKKVVYINLTKGYALLEGTNGLPIIVTEEMLDIYKIVPKTIKIDLDDKFFQLFGLKSNTILINNLIELSKEQGYQDE